MVYKKLYVNDMTAHIISMIQSCRMESGWFMRGKIILSQPYDKEFLFC